VVDAVGVDVARLAQHRDRLAVGRELRVDRLLEAVEIERLDRGAWRLRPERCG
jgi:hypothetical protein